MLLYLGIQKLANMLSSTFKDYFARTSKTFSNPYSKQKYRGGGAVDQIVGPANGRTT